MYFYLFIKSYKLNSNNRPLKSVSLITYISSSLANFLIPIFLILKVKQNFVTFLNFILGLIALVIIFFFKDYYLLAIMLYFFFFILDYVDGGIARLNNNKTFYGKFLDALSGNFFESLFYIGLALFLFSKNNNFLLLNLHLLCCIFYIFDILILDKFSSLVRWCNKENQKSFYPYIRKKYFYRLFLTFHDIYTILVIISVFFVQNSFFFEKIVSLAFLTMFFSGLLNIILHIFYSYKFLNLKKK